MEPHEKKEKIYLVRIFGKGSKNTIGRAGYKRQKDTLEKISGEKQ